MTRIILPLAAIAIAVAGYTLPAHAQLGTSANPPPQHLFDMGTPQPRLNNGLGTMAERRERLATIRRTHRRVHR